MPCPSSPLHSPFPPLRIKNKTALPVVQGGMGVGISAHRLAGAVAAEGAVGTIASIDLRCHHPDLMEMTHRIKDREANKAAIWKANRIALDREIRQAREIAQGRGMIAVNVMRAVSQYREYVQQSCASGADAIVMGAGLPLDLPELTADFPQVALCPILSDERGVMLILKKWMRKGRLPDAIVIEHPAYAGGHLGAAKKEEVTDSRFDFERVIPGVFQIFKNLGLESEKIPLIPAGGLGSHAKVVEMFGLGASAVQVGTAFAVTEEGDAHPEFKKVLMGAVKETVVEFMSCAGLPARAVLTPWVEKYLARESHLMKAAETKKHQCTLATDCLVSCGLRDANPKHGQFCINNQLLAAVRGDVDRGLFFRGKTSLPFGKAIRSARELIQYLLTGEQPALA
ncbi:MAG: nitronate monooxygenase family protein [Zoogloeaceae bacterium]|jgi:nitronate monooxygenase|nr:nitronate monooxygenase family protein [Zoogloeaceae bacterium]